MSELQQPLASDTMQAVTIYADGACKGNPGPGGWGVWLRMGEHQRELCGGEAMTTNNRMELMAVIEGLKALKRRCLVHIYTDSVYVHKGMTEWLAAWRQRGWRTADKKPVKNEDLWRELYDLSQQHHIHWHWVKGHAGDAGNERADSLANLGVAKLLEAGNAA
jgi:ribonuclease HI